MILYSLSCFLLVRWLHQPADAEPFCIYDKSLTPQETVKMNCGFICPNPWGKEDPHDCGAPPSCCCAPRCERSTAAARAFLGINWSDKYSRVRIPRTKMFEILKKNNFYDIKLFSPDGLASIADVYGDEARVYVGIPNKALGELASDGAYARRLVHRQLVPFKNIIRLVIVGNEPFICIRTKDWARNGECGSTNTPAKLLPAMHNVKKALIEAGLSHIPVTSALNGGILEMSSNPWTPCVGDYRSSVLPLLQKLWDFLRSQKPPAPFIINIYSWFATMNGHISPALAAGSATDVPQYDGAFSYFFNVDLQIDMHRIALCKRNATDLDLWIGETGWPSSGHPRATLDNAKIFFSSAIVRARGGTLGPPPSGSQWQFEVPVSPGEVEEGALKGEDHVRLSGVAVPMFLFEAFDEMFKYEIEHGNLFENSFGLFYEDGTPKWKNSQGLLDLPIRQRNNQ